MPDIEIDQEVLDYLRSRVRDFNETPNLVLRRELGLDHRRVPPLASPVRDSIPSEAPRPDPTPAPVVTPVPVSGTSREGKPALTSLGAPEALQQILRVVWLVRAEGVDRVQATIRAAHDFGVERTTIADKYTRQLGLDVVQFDRFLGESDLAGLRHLLLAKFPDHRPDITKTLARVTSNSAS